MDVALTAHRPNHTPSRLVSSRAGREWSDETQARPDTGLTIRTPEHTSTRLDACLAIWPDLYKRRPHQTPIGWCRNHQTSTWDDAGVTRHGHEYTRALLDAGPTRRQHATTAQHDIMVCSYRPDRTAARTDATPTRSRPDKTSARLNVDSTGLAEETPAEIHSD